MCAGGCTNRPLANSKEPHIRQPMVAQQAARLYKRPNLTSGHQCSWPGGLVVGASAQRASDSRCAIQVPLVLVHAITPRKPLVASTLMRYHLPTIVDPDPPKVRKHGHNQLSTPPDRKAVSIIMIYHGFCIWVDLMVFKYFFFI